MFPLYLQGSSVTAPRTHVCPFNALHIRAAQIASAIFDEYHSFSHSVKDLNPDIIRIWSSKHYSIYFA